MIRLISLDEMSSKPRILFLTDLFPNKVERIRGIFNLFRAEALRESGCEVKIIAPVGITPPERFLFPLPKVRKILDHLKSQTSILNVEKIQGFLCRPEDVDDFTEKLSQASKKNWDRSKIACWAKKNYSFEKWTNEMLDLINFEIGKANAVERKPL